MAFAYLAISLLRSSPQRSTKAIKTLASCQNRKQEVDSTVNINLGIRTVFWHSFSDLQKLCGKTENCSPWLESERRGGWIRVVADHGARR